MHGSKGPLPPVVVKISVAMAAAAWVAFVLVHSTYRLNAGTKPMMWVLTLGWPVVYIALLGMAKMGAGIASRGPVSDQWTEPMRRYFPPEIRAILDRFYVWYIPVFLIASTSIVLVIAALMTLANFGVIAS